MASAQAALWACGAPTKQVSRRATDVNPEIRYDAPAKIDEKLREALEKAAKKSFAALGCRDYARIDFRLDSLGRVNFIECNPLPGIAPNFSDLCMMIKAENRSYEQLVSEIMGPALRLVGNFQHVKTDPDVSEANSVTFGAQGIFF